MNDRLPRTTLQAASLHGGDLPASVWMPVSLSEILLSAVADQASGKGVIYLDQDGSETVQPFHALAKEAACIGAGLHKLGLGPQDKVILQLDRATDFLPAFWGCILGGLVPVPLSIPSHYSAQNSAVRRLHHTWQVLSKPVILTSARLMPAIQGLAQAWSPTDLRLADIDNLRHCEPAPEAHSARPDDLAVLMLTSGSTGSPKLVMLSHRNILGSVCGSALVNDFAEGEISFNWLPLSHVGALMRSIREVYLGCWQIQAPFASILAEPVRWLDLIERHQVTTTWAPNFAFGLILGRRAAINGGRHRDLASLKSLWTSGEPISARTMLAFYQLLAKHGLAAEAMHTAWGMTEACFATFSHTYLLDLQEGEGRTPEVGTPIPGLSLRIVDEKDRILPEGVVGRLQIAGPVRAMGYYGDADLNDRAFAADGWLRTGDLGFVRGGRLTVTSRESDVIIVNGVNYSGYEIEAAVESVRGIDASYTAACAVRGSDRDGERLAIFFHAELSSEADRAALLCEIRSMVVRNVGLNPRYLVPLAREEIPKSATGKIQRAQLRQRFAAGEFDAAWQRADALLSGPKRLSGETGRCPAPALPLEGQIAAVFADVLGLGGVDRHDDFFALGGGSVQVVQAVARLAALFPGSALTTVEIFRFPSVRALAGYISQGAGQPDSRQRGADRAALRKAARQKRKLGRQR